MEKLIVIIILTVNEIYREYCASRCHEAACFLMRLCASFYTERSVFLNGSMYKNGHCMINALHFCEVKHRQK